MNDLIKNLYESILYTTQSEFKINDFSSFADYVRKIYIDLLRREYVTETSKSMKLLEIGRTELDNLMLEIIFLNLYEYLTLILQLLKSKGERHEAYLMSLDLPGEEYKKYSERFRKRMQPNRLGLNGIKSFIYTCSHNYHFDGIPPIKYYTPRLLKAYRDVLFIHRQETNIIDISPYYSDIFTALMYEKETDFNNNEYMENKKLIKSYQLWNFSNSTISQIEDIYSMIISSNHALHGDKLVQLLFIEKMFGLISLSELLTKDCNKNEYIKFAHSITLMNCLGYSSFHKTIIKEIDSETATAYEMMIDEHIYPMCTQCITICINEIIHYISRIATEKRIDFINRFRNACIDKIQKSPIVADRLTYNIVSKVKQIKKYRIKTLDDDFAVKLVKELKYQYTNKNSDYEKEYAIKSLMRDYKLEYNIGIDNVEVYDCGVIDLTFDEYDNEDTKSPFYNFSVGIDNETDKRNY